MWRRVKTNLNVVGIEKSVRKNGLFLRGRPLNRTVFSICVKNIQADLPTHLSICELFLEFPFRGGGGRTKLVKDLLFFLDIELCTRSLKSTDRFRRYCDSPEKCYRVSRARPENWSQNQTSSGPRLWWSLQIINVESTHINLVVP